MKVLVATNNAAKLERYRKLLRGTLIELLSPLELGIESVEVEETGKTLAENALLKARAYLGKTELPILANDTGFWVDGEGLIDAPKRTALAGKDEHSFTIEELSNLMFEFWRQKAVARGGVVDAAWVEDFALLMPDGTHRIENSRREVILTDTKHGDAHLQFPMRTLCISKSSGKPSVQNTPEEEEEELAPVRTALISLLV